MDLARNSALHVTGTLKQPLHGAARRCMCSLQRGEQRDAKHPFKNLSLQPPFLLQKDANMHPKKLPHFQRRPNKEAKLTPTSDHIDRTR